MIPDPASVKAETRREASDSSLPRQFRLVSLLASSEFEKARIDLVGGVAIRLASRLNCPTGAEYSRRCGVTLRHMPPDVRGSWNTGSIICRGRDPSGHWVSIQRPDAGHP